ncbi:hypothetical protein [Caloramator sp. CAR-1]
MPKHYLPTFINLNRLDNRIQNLSVKLIK